MNALQEEITQKTLALCVETGKMTAQLLQQAMKKVLADMEKHKTNPQLRHGKQTIRQLMPHMPKYLKEEWAFFLDEHGRKKYNELCRECERNCKQSFRAAVIQCPHYLSKRRTRQ